MELHFLQTVWSDIIILRYENDVAMIDTGFEKQFTNIKKYLDRLGVKKIKFILLTHFHRDHYGSIPDLVKNYDVSSVYFKNYSALDKTTASGMPADEKYRLDEYNKCIEMKKIIEENSTLIEVEKIKEIQFGKYKLELYNNDNLIKKIYDDKSCKDSYHKILFSENQNSLAAFLKVNGVNIFFGGDIYDRESFCPKSSYVNYKIAQEINEQIDIYKVPHHGTINCNSQKALEIYKPKIAIITNRKEYLENESNIIKDLKYANKNVKLLLTEKNNIVIHISEDGGINYFEE